MTRNTKRTGANKPAPEATKPTDEPTPDTGDGFTDDTDRDTDSALRSADSKPSTDEPTPAEPSTDSTAEPTPAEPTDDSRADAFRSAWSAAVEATDDSTGVVPPAVLSPLVEAFRAVKPSKRDDVRGAVMAADTAAAMAASPVDTALLVRSSGVSAALTSAGTKPAVASVTALERREALTLALLSLSTDDDLSDALGASVGFEPHDIPGMVAWLSADALDSDPAGIKRARAALRGAGGRGSSAGRSSGGTRTARSDAPTDEHGKPLPVAERVAVALREHDSDGVGMTDTALSKVAGAGGGAIAAVKQAAADTAGITRVKVNGANGWRIA